MAVYGWVKSVSLEYDPTVKKNVSCKDCIYYESDDRSCNKRGLYLPEDGYNSWKNCKEFELDKWTPNYEEKLKKAKSYGYNPQKVKEEKPTKPLPNSVTKNKPLSNSKPVTKGNEKKDLGGYSIWSFEGKLKNITSEEIRCGYFIFGTKRKKVPAFLCEKEKVVYITHDCFTKYNYELSAPKLYMWFD